MRRLRDLVALLADVLGAVLGLVTVGVAAIAAAGLALRYFGSGRFAGVATLIAEIGGSICLGVLMGAGLMHARHRFAARGYRWIKASYTYTVDPVDPDHHYAETDVTIEATRDDVRIFENRYGWTGTGVDVLPTVRDNGQTVLSPSIVDNSWRHYFIALQQPLARRGTARFNIRQDFRDTGHTFQPFYGKVVIEPLKELTLRVRLPPGTVLSSVTFTHRKSGALNSKVVDVTDYLSTYDPRTGEITWTIPGRPRRNHNYRIDWRV